MELEGRVALVTGGAKRIGRSIALALAARGAHVAITYHSSRREAQDTVLELRRHSVQALALKADMQDSRHIRRLVEATYRQFGRLDILVNSASIFERTPYAHLTQAEWDYHLATNLTAPFLCALHASRLMQRHGGGKIINITDWAGERPYRDYVPYCVSKAGLTALTKALARELGPAIQVMAIAPGPVLPPPDMTAAERRRAVTRLPLGRWGSPQDVASAVVFAIEGNDFMTGTTIYVDGGRSIA